MLDEEGFLFKKVSCNSFGHCDANDIFTVELVSLQVFLMDHQAYGYSNYQYLTSNGLLTEQVIQAFGGRAPGFEETRSFDKH